MVHENYIEKKTAAQMCRAALQFKLVLSFIRVIRKSFILSWKICENCGGQYSNF
jgi:hypothetical protein